MDTDLSYWDIKKVVGRMVPRQLVLAPIEDPISVRKGRRSGYQEFKLFPQGWMKYERSLGNLSSAFEVSCKAAGCPSPLNLDVWDGRVCFYNCLYCFANHFRSTLYDNFFDRVPEGLRSVDLPQLERELGEMMACRGKRAQGLNPEKAAIALGIPVRIGVRFEDFLPQERRDGVALRVLQLLASYGYPVIIDTKSDLLAEDEYLKAMSDNAGGVVVQITLSGVNEELFKKIEPGAPSVLQRFKAIGKINEAGIRAVPRIEPFLPFIADGEEEMGQYASLCREMGVEWICWDAFSYSTASAVTRRLFQREGLDFDRMFLTASDSRLLTGLLLWRMMEHFRESGFKCSTYDDMNSLYNDDVLCCNVKGALKGYGLNLTSTKAVEAYVRAQGGEPVAWAQYSRYVEMMGGWLSEALRDELYHLWNGDGNQAYSSYWNGMEPAGRDIDGLRWRWMGDNPNLLRALRWIENEA